MRLPGDRFHQQREAACAFRGVDRPEGLLLLQSDLDSEDLACVTVVDVIKNESTNMLISGPSVQSVEHSVDGFFARQGIVSKSDGHGLKLEYQANGRTVERDLLRSMLDNDAETEAQAKLSLMSRPRTDRRLHALRQLTVFVTVDSERGKSKDLVAKNRGLQLDGESYERLNDNERQLGISEKSQLVNADAGRITQGLSSDLSASAKSSLNRMTTTTTSTPVEPFTEGDRKRMEMLQAAQAAAQEKAQKIRQELEAKTAQIHKDTQMAADQRAAALQEALNNFQAQAADADKEMQHGQQQLDDLLSRRGNAQIVGTTLTIDNLVQQLAIFRGLVVSPSSAHDSVAGMVATWKHGLLDKLPGMEHSLLTKSDQLDYEVSMSFSDITTAARATRLMTSLGESAASAFSMSASVAGFVGGGVGAGAFDAAGSDAQASRQDQNTEGRYSATMADFYKQRYLIVPIFEMKLDRQFLEASPALREDLDNLKRVCKSYDSLGASSFTCRREMRRLFEIYGTHICPSVTVGGTYTSQAEVHSIKHMTAVEMDNVASKAMQSATSASATVVFASTWVAGSITGGFSGYLSSDQSAGEKTDERQQTQQFTSQVSFQSRGGQGGLDPNHWRQSLEHNSNWALTDRNIDRCIPLWSWLVDEEDMWVDLSKYAGSLETVVVHMGNCWQKAANKGEPHPPPVCEKTVEHSVPVDCPHEIINPNGGYFRVSVNGKKVTARGATGKDRWWTLSLNCTEILPKEVVDISRTMQQMYSFFVSQYLPHVQPIPKSFLDFHSLSRVMLGEGGYKEGSTECSDVPGGFREKSDSCMRGTKCLMRGMVVSPSETENNIPKFDSPIGCIFLPCCLTVKKSLSFEEEGCRVFAVGSGFSPNELCKDGLVCQFNSTHPVGRCECLPGSLWDIDRLFCIPSLTLHTAQFCPSGTYLMNGGCKNGQTSGFGVPVASEHGWSCADEKAETVVLCSSTEMAWIPSMDDTGRKSSLKNLDGQPFFAGWTAVSGERPGSGARIVGGACEGKQFQMMQLGSDHRRASDLDDGTQMFCMTLQEEPRLTGVYVIWTGLPLTTWAFEQVFAGEPGSVHQADAKCEKGHVIVGGYCELRNYWQDEWDKWIAPEWQNFRNGKAVAINFGDARKDLGTLRDGPAIIESYPFEHGLQHGWSCRAKCNNEEACYPSEVYAHAACMLSAAASP
jgi:hypothetical protein